MERRILITVDHGCIAPRFDLTMEVEIVRLAEGGEILSQKTLLLAHSSADELCDLILQRDLDTVICGGIEDEYYHYLRWKRIEVYDGIIGSVAATLARLAAGSLRPGDILPWSAEDA